jgi:hypothetical protein
MYGRLTGKVLAPPAPAMADADQCVFSCSGSVREQLRCHWIRNIARELATLAGAADSAKKIKTASKPSSNPHWLPATLVIMHMSQLETRVSHAQAAGDASPAPCSDPRS